MRQHLVDRGLRLLGIGGEGHLEAGVAQVDGNQLGNGGFVLDDQDSTHLS